LRSYVEVPDDVNRQIVLLKSGISGGIVLLCILASIRPKAN
jgi:hypothetical protein